MMNVIRRSLCLALIVSALPLCAAPPGTVVAWGRNDYGQTNVPAGLNDVIAIAAGGAHSVALRSDGTVVAWGLNDHGQTNVPVGLTGVMAIAAGDLCTVALKRDGTVVAWGSNEHGETSIPPGLSGVTAIAAGSAHVVALKNDGTVVEWGGEWRGYTLYRRAGPALRGVIAIAAGPLYSIALRDDGTVEFWGEDFYLLHSLSLTTDFVAIAPYAALRRDGTVLAWEIWDDAPTVVPDLSDVVAVDSGMVLRRDGTVATWELRFTAPGNRSAFVQETGLSGVTAIAAAVASPADFPFDFRSTGHFVALLGPPPVISQQPLSQTVSVGQSTTFRASAAGEGSLSYQWTKDGLNVPGATSAAMTLSNVQRGDLGNYAVVVTNPYRGVTSNLAALRLDGEDESPRGKLTNFSVRAAVDSRAPTLIAGFAVDGAGTLPVLLRGVGPGLSAFGVSTPLSDPVLTLFQGGTLLNSNDNWDFNSQVSSVSAGLGAFALAPGSLDAALFQSGIALGSYTVQVAGKSAPTGVALTEIYDATSSSAPTTARLVNVSARGQIDGSGNEVVAGFIVSGRGSTQLLIRGVGPALGRFGVTGALEDPVLRIYDRAGVLIATNDDWNSDPLLRASFSAVHAFELPPASKDAALLVRVQPGAYTAVLSHARGNGGEGLIEIYELP